MKKLKIQPIEHLSTLSAAKLLQTIINDLDYYTVQAKKNEIKKYTSTELKYKIKNDHLSVLGAFDENGKLVGFCLSRWDDFTIWLEWIGVAEKVRGKGIAKKLLIALEKTLKKRKAHKIWCDCRTKNEASIKLLTTLGYRKIAEIKNHWYGQDFYLWQKEIR